eukprot:CAMPEP_0204168480 /NCGR_PEP_ID=MMETSP0361-20130328/40754_1 /ASSEMBLY_ACC=CAM_ASM_000343 /TAXON_ID=268821 /ORGANISM="Scrippsiella Hangoei, Strain SHTV-5" /LENGTH=593 /DNA_ID=CAMNT_0051125941 /DNA_START=6 /DNA_END=1784 /DNA_ORIENTATION=-
MACMRPRKQKLTLDASAPPSAHVFAIWHLVARAASCLGLPEVAALRSACRCADEACSSDMVWEQLFKGKWNKEQAAGGADQRQGDWKQQFLVRLRRLQAAYQAKTLPSLVQKLRRKDGLPDLQKMHESLRIKFSLALSPPSGGLMSDGSKVKHLHLRSESVGIFSTSVLVRCSFSNLTFSPPLRLHVRARSSALGSEHELLTAAVLKPSDKSCNCIASDEHFMFIRSSCGRALFCVWKKDSTLAGLFVSMHHMHILEPFLATGPQAALETLAGRPGPDDIDSQLGLHDYSVLLTMHSSKLEVFSNCFYKVAVDKENAFGATRVHRTCVLDQRAADEKRPQAGAAARAGAASGEFYEAKVANFEVLAPHESGGRPPFPCVRPPQLVFQSLAFKSCLPDTLFVDATVFDEHGHICWATSMAVSCQSGGASPHESLLAARRFAAVDFDREHEGQGDAVRWLCVAEHGAAQLVVQLEYGHLTTPGDDRQLPRLNAISWHPELSFLDAWWGSKYASSAASGLRTLRCGGATLPFSISAAAGGPGGTWPEGAPGQANFSVFVLHRWRALGRDPAAKHRMVSVLGCAGEALEAVELHNLT